MTTTITGLSIQAELGTTVTVANLEYMIDAAIDDVNTDAELTLAYMTGTAGSKTLTVTGAQARAIKEMLKIKLAQRDVQGGSSTSYSLGVINESSSTNNSGSNINMALYRKAIAALRSAPIYLSNEPIPTVDY